MLLKYETIVSLSESIPKICEKNKNQSFQEWISNDLFSHIKLEELFVKLCFERQPAITPFLRHFQIWGILFSTGFPGWETKTVCKHCSSPPPGYSAPRSLHLGCSPRSVVVESCSVRWDTRPSQLANQAKFCLGEYLCYSSRQIFFFWVFLVLWGSGTRHGDSGLAQLKPSWSFALYPPVTWCTEAGTFRYATDTTLCDEYTPYLQSPKCTEQLYITYSD